jgi:hypothetical protein
MSMSPEKVEKEDDELYFHPNENVVIGELKTENTEEDN